MNTSPLPNIPWEERPADSSDVVWRYSFNPIIRRDLIPSSNSIFNSAVVPFQGNFAGVFRCDNKKREMNLHRGFSENGIDWTLDDDPIEWLCNDPEIDDTSTATTPAWSGLRIDTMSYGVMVITDRRSGLAILSISRSSSS